MTKNQSYLKALKGHFSPTDECLRKTKHAFVAQIDNLLAKARFSSAKVSSKKEKKEAAMLCQGVRGLLLSEKFKTTKDCDEAYLSLWNKFENVCQKFVANRRAKTSVYKGKKTS